jgi:DNA-binding SARP family transcriptional activator
LHPNESVHGERLALALRGEDAPASSVKTTQVYVSRLREALGDAEVLLTTPAGYRLRVRADELDAERSARLVEDGRRALDAGQAERAAAVLRQALWRGPPLAELAFEPFAQAEIARLQEQRLAATEACLDADLAAGRHAPLVGELRQLAAASPTRERHVGQLQTMANANARLTDRRAPGSWFQRIAASLPLEGGQLTRAETFRTRDRQARAGAGPGYRA